MADYTMIQGLEDLGEGEEEEVGYQHIEVNGEDYDLSDREEAYEARDELAEYRQQLRDGELDEYEDHPTEYRGGGRTRLLYDEVRAQLAVDYHEGKHDMTWEEQDQEAKNTQRIVAIVRAKQGKV